MQTETKNEIFKEADEFETDDECDEETSENESDFEQEEITEEWKTIEDYENYEINNFGLVRNVKTQRILKPSKTRDNYFKLNLSKNGKVKKFYIHRLLASAFIENPNNYD
jgi:hypothetical protein